MQGIQILLTPFVWVLMFFYNIFGNYGMALIFFALLVKIILFPFSLKGKKSMIQMNMVQGKMNQLQKQYGKDKDRYNQEVQKMYEKEHVNPMSGCLWSLLPMLVIFPLYAIIRQPLTYVMNLSAEQITTLLSVLPQAVDQTNAYFQLSAAEILGQNFQAVFSNPAVAGFAEQLKAINFNLLGVNLANIPQPMFWKMGMNWNSIGLFLLPVISAASGLFFSQISMKTNSVNQQSAQNNSTSKMMLIMSPVMSLWIGFVMPGGLSIYWIANNIFSMFQEMICSKMLKKDYEKVAAEQARRAEEEKEEEKRQKAEAAAERAKRIEEAKKNRGKKPVPAKKKDDEMVPATVKAASREGIRAYARGRAYDPTRFRPEGATAYMDPAAARVDETAHSLEEQADHLETTEPENAGDDVMAEALLPEDAAAEGQAALQEPQSDAPSEGADSDEDVTEI